MKDIQGVSGLIEAFGGIEPFGKFLFSGTGQPKARACDIRRRGYIPPIHWDRLVRWAEKNGYDLTVEQLRRWRSRAPKRTKADRAA